MLVVISPAKNLDYDTPSVTTKHSQPDFLEEAQILIDEIKVLSPENIADLMKLSSKLATLNSNRYLSWSVPFDASNAKQAVLAFNGDVYTGLAAETFNDSDFEYAQKNLRILSGLYGLLKPLDLMQAYRLEMGTKFENSRGKNLYEFWGETITQALNTQLNTQETQVVINLASNEYFKSVKPKLLNAEVIVPQFKDQKNGKFKIISFYAKKARGLMAGYIIKNKIESVEDLKHFDVDGYYYCPEQSDKNTLMFLRNEITK
jgi:cytoplasmic iron level regulating protein YaaA (DUF328/UPF0246 family)